MKQKALLTGSTGFVGNHLAQRLLRDGWEVSLLIRDSSNVKKIESLSGNPVIYKTDGRTRGVIEIIRTAQPEVIFHLAGLVLVDHQPEDVEELIHSNILFGTQVLQGMVETQARFFVNTGSYWEHYDNKDFNPVNLYAATKKAFADILCYYSEVYSVKSITLKLFDVYGPSDTRGKIFSLLEQAYLTGKPLVMSPGEQQLDLVYVEDVVQAYIQAANLLESHPSTRIEEYAVSSGRRITLKKVVEIYQKILNHKLPIVWGRRPYRRREVMVPWQGRALPGWKASVDLETGIQRVLSDLKTRKGLEIAR